MNILILAKESHVGGLLNYTFNLAQGLVKKNDTNVVIGISPSGANEPLKPFNLQEINFETKSPLCIIKNYLKIARIIKKYKIDIIQSHNRIPSLYAWIYCTFHRRIKYVWVNLVLPIPSSFLYRVTTKYGSYAITGTDGIKPLMEDLKIPKEKLKVINLGVDFSKFTRTSIEEQAALKRNLGIKDGEKVILLYGRLDKIKGHEFLLDSLHAIKNTDYKVIFPGENIEYKNYLQAIIKKYNIEEKVLFPGFINGREYLSISDLMILPSAKEGLSYAFLESISMGVPVIRTKTGGYYDDVKNLCSWVNYGEIDKLAQLIGDFLNGNEMFAKKAELAKKESYRFSLENMIDEFYNLYCNVLEKQSC